MSSSSQRLRRLMRSILHAAMIAPVPNLIMVQLLFGAICSALFNPFSESGRALSSHRRRGRGDDHYDPLGSVFGCVVFVLGVLCFGFVEKGKRGKGEKEVE